MPRPLPRRRLLRPSTSPRPRASRTSRATRAPAPPIYFTASEGLTNVARHARARRAWLRLRIEGPCVALTIEDDGVGGADARSGSGLRGLRDRVEALGGQLSVGPREGGGTVLVAVVP